MITKVKKWLGKDGIACFRKYKENYGTVSPIFIEDKIPHPVHFREGMQVRNFLRTLEECKDWTSHDFDNKWKDIIEEAI